MVQHATKKSRCPRSECDGVEFEVETLNMPNTNFYYTAVQCSTCGAVVGVVDHVNLVDMLKRIGKHLGLS